MNEIKSLGIIAGSGNLPKLIYDSCTKSNIKCQIFGIEGQVEPHLFDNKFLEIFKPSSLSKMLKSIKSHNIKHIVFAGKVTRSIIPKVILDIKGAMLVAKIITQSATTAANLGDNTILSTVIKFFESEGFEVLPAEKFAINIIMPKGCITKRYPNEKEIKDIEKGVHILKEMSKFDIGQALVTQGGLILGIEAAEGTDALIQRSGVLSSKSDMKVYPILVKIVKLNQDQRIDLPCIGMNTVQNAIKQNFAGIAIESESSLILDQNDMVLYANKNNFFIYGI